MGVNPVSPATRPSPHRDSPFAPATSRVANLHANGARAGDADGAPPARGTHPAVSVLLPVHNQEGAIRETLDHLLSLEWPSFEVVVVDDGSTDGTVDKVLPLVEEGRVRLMVRETSEGPQAALEAARPMLRGDVAVLVDADGRVRPDSPDSLRWRVLSAMSP
jgi:cellulose synthase/poly-beta-1,6-N-acetylglucosamine synthase-like glycosyltransferase